MSQKLPNINCLKYDKGKCNKITMPWSCVELRGEACNVVERHPKPPAPPPPPPKKPRFRKRG